jgi:prepilin-type N-terminal cleavage/methylation domain-containing protein
MMKRETGFSLIELLIVIAILGFVLAAISDMFVGLLRGYKQQSKITETNIEGVIGLEMLRRDIQSAGYGLPWIIPAGTTYSEVTNVTAPAYFYNDASNPPRAILSDFDTSGRAYLVIKAINVARNDACTKWTHLLSTGGTITTTTWTPLSENLKSTDWVIVISPGTPATTSRTLVASGGFFTTFGSLSLAGFSSSDENRIIYGVDPKTVRMPFNRADYYVNNTSVTIPGRCAQGTGILMKAVLNQGDGGFSGSSLPLLDCVADMQVVYNLDTDLDGQANLFSNGLSPLIYDAQTIRDQLKEIRVYILAHEGQRDMSYTHTINPMLVGESATGGRLFNFATNGITNWQNYRWKVYTLVVRPNSLN